MKICLICNKEFEEKHFNQQYCCLDCKYKAKRNSQEKYKKTDKGKTSRLKWVNGERFKNNEKVYRQKPRAKHLAVLRAKKYLERHEHARIKKRELDKIYGVSEIGRINNRKATIKYRKTEKGKWLAKTYKYKLRHNESGKIDKDKWIEKLNLLEGKCQMCGTKDNITIDHIVPLSKNGTNRIDNLQPLCRSCNCRKSNKL